MEQQKDNDESSIECVRRIVTPIFKKVLSEGGKNPTMVGLGITKEGIRFLWQPHNYRLYLDFDKTNFNPPKPSTDPTPQNFGVGFNYCTRNHGSEHHFDSFYGCRIIVKKSQVEVINKFYEQQWLLINAENPDEVDKRISQKIDEMDGQCFSALKKLIDVFGGKSDFRILNRRGEYGMHGDEYLDKIPYKMIIHDTHFHQLYNEPKVEFKKPAYIKNYVSNRAIEKIAPEIANELTALHEKVNIIMPFFNGFPDNKPPTLSELMILIKEILTMNKDVEATNAASAQINKETAAGLNAITQLQFAHQPKNDEEKTDKPTYIG